VVCKDGSIKWVEEWMIHEKDENGILISEKGVLRDITEQTNMVEKLKISENRYKKLFENTSALVFSFDLVGNIIEKNMAFTNIFGDDQKNFFDINLYLTTKGFEGRKMNALELINYIEKNPGKILEYSLEKLDGRNFVIEIRFSLRYEGDKSIEIQGIGQDISYRKEAERKLKYISEHDKLSGLYNREYFDRKLEELNANREFPFSIVVGDMNGLKITNDAFGHSKGDELIFNMGKICSNNEKFRLKTS
jgi:PAS domain S-box-containing protein